MSRYHVTGEAVRGAALLNERIALGSMELGGESQGGIKRDRKLSLSMVPVSFAGLLAVSPGLFTHLFLCRSRWNL